MAVTSVSLYAFNHCSTTDGSFLNHSLCEIATDSGVLKMLVLNATVGVDQEILPESDEGTYGPITLPTYGFPFWSSDREQVYVCNLT